MCDFVHFCVSMIVCVCMCGMCTLLCMCVFVHVCITVCQALQKINYSEMQVLRTLLLNGPVDGQGE